MKKFFARSILAASLTFVALGVHADYSTKTHQLKSDVTLKATKDGKGNAIITWSSGVPVHKVEHYVGDGKSWGKPYPILVSGNTRAVLSNLKKNGSGFNLVMKDHLFLHLECGGNTETTEPKFEGMRKECVEDPKTGHKVGRLVVN